MIVFFLCIYSEAVTIRSQISHFLLHFFANLVTKRTKKGGIVILKQG